MALGIAAAVAFLRAYGAKPAGSVETGQAALAFGRQGTADADAVAGHGDGGDIGSPPGVAGGAPAELGFVPGLGTAGGGGELVVGYDALMQQRELTIDACLVLAADPVGHGLEASLAETTQRRDAGQNPHAMAPDLAHPAPALDQGGGFRPDPGQVAKRPPGIGPRRGVEHGLHWRPGLHQLPGHEVQQRPAAGQHQRHVGHLGGRLEQRLGGPRRHHAGQRPARHRHRPFHGAGAYQHALGAQQPGPFGPQDAKLAVRRDLPDAGLRQVTGGTGAESGDQPVAAAVFLAKQGVIAGPLPGDLLDGSVDLSPGRRPFVENHRLEAAIGRHGGGGQAGRAGADHRQVVSGIHGATSRGPDCRRTDMPSRTGSWQAWRLATPSISTRQSKQTPIRQCAERGSPETADLCK